MKAGEWQIPTCSIMGVNIAAIDMQQLLNFTHKHVKELSGRYICVSNVHTTVTAYDDESYRTVQNNAVLAIPDGGPLSSVGRKRGFPAMQRTTGPEYMEKILTTSAEYGYRHYFYGSTDETLRLMCEKLRERYPGLQIAGTYSPPFRPLTAEEDAAAISRINDAQADFVWVGLGAPKQERWMAQHEGQLHGLMVGVGAGFDYFAGNIKRAPQWMQRCNLEWLYRLLQDPKRLFKRYLYTNVKFIWKACIKGE